MNQEEIVIKLKQGDKAVFSDVVAGWQDMVYNLALSIVHNNEDAEDVTQEVFVQLYRSVDRFRGEAMLSTWLYRVTLRKALDEEKKKSREKRTTGSNGDAVSEAVHFDHPGVLVENKEKAAMLFSALKQIPENQRVAFTLQKMEGLDYREIASIMDITLSAVESLLVRAKQNLKKILHTVYENAD